MIDLIEKNRAPLRGLRCRHGVRRSDIIGSALREDFNPEQSDPDFVVEFVHSCRCAGKALFVHCDAGVDRSAMVVIAYFMWQRHCARDEALEFVQRKRSVVRPSPAFMQLLDEWEAAIGSASRA
ncbi:MAG: dual specificity protein phosphatase [Tepidisphaeraceae bacterium]